MVAAGEEAAMMHAYGRTLRQVGDLRLLALPVDGGGERYCVADGPEPVAAYPTLEQASAAFEAVCMATDEATHRRQLAASGVSDLTTYRVRRRRPRGSLTGGPRPPRPEEP
jgi:hypothetical protein